MNTTYNMTHFTHTILEMPSYTDSQLLRKVVVEEVFISVEWMCGNRYHIARSILTPHSQYLKNMYKDVYLIKKCCWMERIATSQWICVRKIVRFYAVLIIVIVVSMKSFSFVYCFLFVFRFIGLSFHFCTLCTPKNIAYILCCRNWDI